LQYHPNEKKTLIAGAIMTVALGANAQGIVNFVDGVIGFTMHIYGPQESYFPVQGTGPNDDPPGTTMYDAGSALGGSSTGSGLGNGNNITVELYAAPGLGDALSSLVGVGQYTGHLATKPGGVGEFVPNGILGPDPGIPGTSGGTATVVLVAWFNGGGAYSSLTAAEAAGQDFGFSAPVSLTALGDLGSPPNIPPPIGITSFSLGGEPEPITPEPSTIALGVMGASAFLFRRRMSK
jgi:hypothetical protein